MKFIDRVAAFIREENTDLTHLTIVLPSERAKKYLIAALYHQYGRPIMAPEIVTMDQWVQSFSPKAIIDKTRALIALFEIQLENAKSQEDYSFDEFLNWGPTLISDFNEIDRYLLEAKHVFRNLADIKELEQWNVEKEALTESQKRFMEFWDRLPNYYYALNTHLDEQGMCYAGKAFQFLANHIHVLFENDKDRRFVFAGFNALSKSEMAIIKQLEQMGRATILIDADTYYLNNKTHEAGRFLRDLSTALDGKKLNFVENQMGSKPLRVDMIECSQKTGQVKVAATLLESLSKEEIDQTLLLLADESLIGAMIKNLPKKIGKANITLGLPIRNTAVRTWVDVLFSVQENKRRFKTQSIYFNDLLGFWNHPFVLAMMSAEEKELVHVAEKRISEMNTVFLNPSRLNLGPIGMELVLLMTTDWEQDWERAIKTIRKINGFVYEHLDGMYVFERAIVEAFDRALIDFENIVTEGIPEMSLKSFKQLFHQHWGMKSMSFHGNPLDGLQIMGLLETRALDFKRIICLGMNEGNLPPTNPIQTMIPMDLRRYLQLPTPREKQGLFAHHFYRLLHQCEELHVTYNSADESIGSNEPSRYLMQLELELSRINPQVHVQKRIYSLADERTTFTREIQKTPEIQHRLDRLLEHSVSASMIKKYLTCPLDFYFRYVMDFGEEDEVEEEIETSTFGTFIHNTLEELYRPYSKYDERGVERIPAPPAIRSVDVEKMRKEFKLILHAQFLAHFNNDVDAFMKGKNLLSYQMATELTDRFLKSEIDFLGQQSEPVYIISLEREYTAEIELSIHGAQKKVRLRGFIDRIDQIGNTIRIIDYKSGKVTKEDVSFRVKDVEQELIVESLGNRKHLLQLIQYGYLYFRNHGEVPESSIISFISGNNVPFTLNTEKIATEDVIQQYPEYLARILNEIYDESIPFRHNTDQYFSYCAYCE